MEREMADEMQQHLEARTEDLVRSGLTREKRPGRRASSSEPPTAIRKSAVSHADFA